MRRSILLSLLLLLLVATYLATSSAFWLHWATLVIFFGVLLLADVMFLNEGAMEFDPFYASWSKKNAPDYFKSTIG